LSQRRHYDPSPRLARLFEIGTGDVLDWKREDLRVNLTKQLNTPLSKWLNLQLSDFPGFGLATSTIEVVPIRTVGDLLNHPSPPLQHLRSAKNVAKVADARLKAPLPPPVASALYVSMIAVAIVRYGRQITIMNDVQLREGLFWVAGQTWVEQSMRQMATAALEVLRNRK
jgi:hypothetical protein